MLCYVVDYSWHIDRFRSFFNRGFDCFYRLCKNFYNRFFSCFNFLRNNFICRYYISYRCAINSGIRILRDRHRRVATERHNLDNFELIGGCIGIGLYRGDSRARSSRNNPRTALTTEFHPGMQLCTAVATAFNRRRFLGLLLPELLRAFCFNPFTFFFCFLSCDAGMFFNTSFFFLFVELFDHTDLANHIHIEYGSNGDIITATFCRKAGKVIAQIVYGFRKIRSRKRVKHRLIEIVKLLLRTETIINTIGPNEYCNRKLFRIEVAETVQGIGVTDGCSRIQKALFIPRYGLNKLTFRVYRHTLAVSNMNAKPIVFCARYCNQSCTISTLNSLLLKILASGPFRKYRDFGFRKRICFVMTMNRTTPSTNNARLQSFY